MWTGIVDILYAACDVLWGTPMAVVMLLTGVWFTARTGFFQFRHLSLWLRHTVGTIFSCDGGRRQGAGQLSQLQAVTTALAATVGTGSVAGVAAAIAVGGPGAVFWMWISAVLCMMTAFAENVLGIHYRVRRKDGCWQGGPMAYMEYGLGWKKLASAYALCCTAASFGIGSLVQSNSVAAGLSSEFGVPLLACGGVLAIVVLVVSLGGVQRIGRVTEAIVPFMVGLYVLSSLCCVIAHADALPKALADIVREAFSLRAGVSGSGCGLLLALRTGVCRGIFSHEAGLGSSVLVHAQADVREPVQQGMWAMFEVVIDTLVVCTVTALVILTSGVYDQAVYAESYGLIGLAGGPKTGVELTAAAFSATYGVWGGRFVAVSMVFFAVSTILGWSWYGRAAAEYLFGRRSGVPFEFVFALAVLIGALLPVGPAWELADLFNGLMAVPNLIAIWLLTGEVVRLKKACLRARTRLE